MDELRFDGRVAVVTGAGRGIGRCHALLLAARGAKVVVADYGGQIDGGGASAAPAELVVKEIAAAGGDAVASFASVAEEDGAAAIVQTALDAFGRLDIVINNAGISDKAPFMDLPSEKFRRMVDVHFLGTLYVTKAAWPHLVDAGAGRVVNTTSEAVLGTLPQLTSYASAKGAVLALTKSLAGEAAGTGIRVNAVAPRARTRMSEGGKEAYPAGSELRRRVEAHLARLDPELISPAAAYLAHESCRINGEALVVGGGAVHRLTLAVSKGIARDGLTVEDVAAGLDEILDMTDATIPTAGRS
ncbi:SDR family NAD(P)-dependent oxidoreductase [Frankia sp. CNm7]|uniref:SDR family NAD(P)-dependent oxidoreductase n=1 Tax=Frankia nepalensis TaxID=1836974 RepID=A0A937RST5_9ACTN|nr:SDR family NAD(P)-dependent oxidoreductase [Frankia nepalensis]MBL7499154.1 SDR family NAD(P)-dependent oxidoreductase [Frankia nepalensis]MBL7511028.1 SDR family NAD(P)-dependent oxidoreductase [Frankia nepalensis]MBL7520504.1 SDR family NAD(P)-dependent oxidoreductase [Frankia nepalensis]MBL7632108.1 SDR family NAD(P)-dependent oxidoreductase [Frankia nepalensis]